jgi:dephospho-CoA kinase
MMKIGITGGIGSGKSTVCKVFNVLGVPIYNADENARRLMAEDESLVKKIKNLLGEDVYRNGRPDRTKIASLVFSNREKLEQLNALVHPVVGRDFLRWADSYKNHAYIIKEAAILFESGADKGLDAVIFVSAPKSLRVQRIIQRDGVTEEQVKQRMKNQWPETKKKERARFTLVNDEKKMLLPQVIRLHNKLIGMSKNKEEKA